MKINTLSVLIAVSISMLLAFAMWDLGTKDFRDIRALGAVFFLSTSLGMTIGTTFSRGRTSVNVKAVTAVFFIIQLVTHVAFSAFPWPQTVYCVVSCIAFLTMVLLIRTVQGAME